jgi:hypothetical protein
LQQKARLFVRVERRLSHPDAPNPQRSHLQRDRRLEQISPESSTEFPTKLPILPLNKSIGHSRGDPALELPDNTPIDRIRFPARIQNGLAAAGPKTVGEVCETSDEVLLSFKTSDTAQLPICAKRWVCRRATGSGSWAKSQSDLLNF